MANRLLGTGVTDANGVASMTYTGVGAGKLQIIAETENISSDEYELIDAIWYDRATINNHNTWNTQNLGDSLQYTDDYTTFGWNGNSSSGAMILRNVVTDVSFVNIEMDIKYQINTNENPNVFTLRALGGTLKLYYRMNDLNLNDNEWHHIKISIRGLTSTLEVDGVTIGNKNITDNTWYAIQLQVSVLDALLSFKNFMVY